MCGPPPPPPPSSPPTVINILISATVQYPFPPAITDGFSIVFREPDDANLTTNVKSGDVIVFRKTGDITDITGISQEGGMNVFSTVPTRQADGSWQGVIGSFAPNSEESYTINYVVNGITYSQDPKIRINQ